MITGLCEHYEEKTNINAWLFRSAFIFTSLITFGGASLIYLALSWVTLWI